MLQLKLHSFQRQLFLPATKRDDELKIVIVLFRRFKEQIFFLCQLTKRGSIVFFRITTKQIFDRKKQIKLEVMKNVREEITRIDDDKEEQRERYNGRKPGIASAA